MLVTTRMPHRVFHKVYDADYVGAVGSDDAALQTSSVIESTAGGTVLVGSSRRQAGFDAALDLDAVREIARKATRVFPFLADAAVMRVYGGFRPFMPDHLPVIGADPRVAGLWHATGHEGAGVGLALGTAELLRDVMTGRPPHSTPSPSRPLAPRSASERRRDRARDAAGGDPVRPGAAEAVTIVVDGEPVTGVRGQSIAGVLLAADRTAWRTTAAGRRPRGIFCGIGVCFDCLVAVGGVRDIRACQRPATDGDLVTTQDETLPETTS
ncbi:hypothetical protein GCM10025881_17970 [Pseudolysinimonas kribbensis]|uniref:FAD dependent oxidoreductase domain-containing protein n=1 Tax=Pseudolysinimonas kribbensis TaxID=433641 RepID=A0ABQ6K3E4_9MICO|nr:hypothetical protein GCM10025881_17970 [Pseudolysinimonas kribbensis]